MANWLRLSAIKEWEDIFFPGFQYDSITDADIAAALSSPFLVGVDPNKDWEDDSFLYNSKEISERQKHAFRVAALVNMMQQGHVLKDAVCLDTFSLSQCLSGVPNGHHRIRALQYLGMDMAPFSLAGNLDSLERLVSVAGCESPDPCFARYFSDKLLAPPNPNDDVIIDAYYADSFASPSM